MCIRDSYVGDQFKVDQATGNVTLDASAFNLSGLESLRLGSVGGLIGASIGEFSTDVTMSQNSDTKVSTQKAVKTYVDTVDGTTPVGGTFTVAGISTVTGTTQFTKQLNVSGVSTFHNNVNLLDGDKLFLGSSQDLQIFHDSNHSYIQENGTGDLRIKALTGGVELYHNDVLRIQTSTTGVSIGGSLSVAGVLTYEDVTNVDSIGIVTARSQLNVGSNIKLGNAGVVTATSYRGDGSQLTGIDATSLKDSGGNTKIQAQASGLMVTGITTVSGNIMPGADNTLNLGSLSQRWANIYVGDMNLSNKGSSNIVDGTWGNFTLQEGESNLFIINNRTGKRYKFDLTEIPLGDD